MRERERERRRDRERDGGRGGEREKGRERERKGEREREMERERGEEKDHSCFWFRLLQRGSVTMFPDVRLVRGERIVHQGRRHLSVCWSQPVSYLPLCVCVCVYVCWRGGGEVREEGVHLAHGFHQQCVTFFLHGNAFPAMTKKEIEK